MTQQRRHGGSRTALRAWPTALVLATASFLVLFDSLAVATALPSIGAEFGLRPAVLQWVISLYSVSIGALLVLGGRICDLWSRRRVLLASLALCAAAGLLAGLAPTLPLLLAGRVLQGLAAAFAIPAALATAGTVFPDEPWRSRVFSVIAFASWSAGLGGAILGGLITTHFGWRWVFLGTVPAALAAVAVASATLPADPPGRIGGGRLDLAGGILACTGLVTLILGLQQLGGNGGGNRGAAAGILCTGLLLLAGLVARERRAADPLVKPQLLRSPAIVGGYLAFGAYCAAYNAVVVVGSVFLQDVHGLSAAGAGLVLAPVLVGGVLSSALGATLLRRLSTRAVVTAALLLCAVSLTAIATQGRGSVPALVPWLVLWGLCSGPVYIGLTRECIGSAAEEDRGTVSAIFESMSHVGGAVAIAVYLTLLGAGLGYGPTQLVGAAVVAAGAVAAFLLLPRPGAAASAPEPPTTAATGLR